jgi:multiple antibiotic resistance protein
MVNDKTKAEKNKTALVCAASVMIILVVTTWIGLDLLKFFGISIGAFQGAGGIIVLLIGLSMLKGKAHNHEHDSTDNPPPPVTTTNNIAVVPLAMPIIAGPGAMTALIAHMQNLGSVYDKLIISLICIILSALIAIVLFFAPTISRLLGDYGMNIVTRVMGMVLAAIAFGMLASGVGTLFPGLM